MFALPGGRRKVGGSPDIRKLVYKGSVESLINPIPTAFLRSVEDFLSSQVYIHRRSWRGMLRAFNCNVFLFFFFFFSFCVSITSISSLA